MKHSKIIIGFTAFLVLIIFMVLFVAQMPGDATIEKMGASSLEDGVQSSLGTENEELENPTVIIDDKEYDSEKYDIFTEADQEVMIAVSMLREAMNCSARVYDKEKLLIEKHNRSVQLVLGDKTAVTDDGEAEVEIGLVESDGAFYISLRELSGLLGYSYQFDSGTNTVTAKDTDTSAVYPDSYDLREKGRVSKIYSQGTYGTCWAFAATSALESSLLPEVEEVFSVDHMTMSNSFNANQYDGGEYTMGMAYLSAWQGPVNEEDDPYGDGVSDDTLTAEKHVQEIQIIDSEDYEGIKKAVFLYGGVESSLYSTIKSSEGSSSYYNKDTSAYCYIGTEKPNHDVVIIGWDDNYSSSNFTTEPEGDGAFICQNSWGESFGEEGIFYVSYYDSNIGTHNVVYTRVDEVDNYDHIYQSDLCGWVGKIGYDKESIYGANVFEATGDEVVCAAGFYATGADTSYKVYIVGNFEDESSFGNRIEVAAGTLENAGYYTIDLDETFAVNAGERYAVVVYVNTPESTHPMAIEYDTGDPLLADIDLDDGEGYISLNGENFINVKEKRDCNLCIKAFTKDR